MSTNQRTAFLHRGATVATAVAITAASSFGWLGGCAKDDPKPPVKAPASKIVPESYPIRIVFISYLKDPKLPRRTEAEAVARANEALAKVRAPGGDFEAVAKEMSEDPVTATDGGFVGFVGDWTGDPKAVVEAARALKVGEISGPVGTSTGQQIVQRLSREEGKAIEAKYVAPVEGVLVQWHDLVPSLPVTDTKDAAYEEAAKVVVSLRAGEYPIGVASGKLLGAKDLAFPVRHGSGADYAKLIDAVFATKPNDITDPIETRNGWFIALRKPYVRCYARHIVITSESSPANIQPSKRTPVQARALAREALDRLLREPGAWDELVRNVSEEPASKTIGGFVGDLSNAVMAEKRAAPEFEAAVWALAPGATSDLVDTRFGIHIMRRDD